jgi:hypothetical protein
MEVHNHPPVRERAVTVIGECNANANGGDAFLRVEVLNSRLRSEKEVNCFLPKNSNKREEVMKRRNTINLSQKTSDLESRAE